MWSKPTETNLYAKMVYLLTCQGFLLQVKDTTMILRLPNLAYKKISQWNELKTQ